MRLRHRRGRRARTPCRAFWTCGSPHRCVRFPERVAGLRRANARSWTPQARGRPAMRQAGRVAHALIADLSHGFFCGDGAAARHCAREIPVERNVLSRCEANIATGTSPRQLSVSTATADTTCALNAPSSRATHDGRWKVRVRRFPPLEPPMHNQQQTPAQQTQSGNNPGQPPGRQDNDRQDDATRETPQRQTPGSSEEEE